MLRWKIFCFVLGLLAVFVFLATIYLGRYDPVPGRMRALVFSIVRNYEMADFIANLTRNNKIVLGFLAEDIVRNPDRVVTPINKKDVEDKRPVGLFVFPSFHVDLYSLYGVVVGGTKDTLVLDVNSEKYELRVRRYSIVSESNSLSAGYRYLSDIDMANLVDTRVFALVLKEPNIYYLIKVSR